jgi:hypothetical protein
VRWPKAGGQRREHAANQLPDTLEQSRFHARVASCFLAFAVISAVDAWPEQPGAITGNEREASCWLDGPRGLQAARH